jgi:diguanylate cyclase (GGDEF)-like protein
MNFITMPDFVLILWMAIVLATLRRKREGHFMRLWIGGLAMIVVEGVARILYLQHATARQHTITHVIALDAYFLAGAAFFQSAIERVRTIPRAYLHLTFCALPYLFLLTGYGSGLSTRSFYIPVAVFGLLSSFATTYFFAKSLREAFIHALIWLSILGFALAGQQRGAAYFGLFSVFAAIAIIFYFAVASNSWGRVILIAGFSLWSICFLSHPWVATSHKDWITFAEKIWDLQKFVVTFGLLILTLEEASAANEYDAMHDTLTGIPNLRLFNDRLQQDIARARRADTRVVLFNIDLDKFKQVNDNWGHEAGDFLLKEVTRRLRTVTRETDTLARVGGDEFYLVVSDYKLHAAPQAGIDVNSFLIHLLRSSVEDEPCVFEFNGAHIHLHARLSIGYAVFPEQSQSIEGLCRIADMRMYEDKRARSASGATVSSPRVQAVTPIREASGPRLIA